MSVLHLQLLLLLATTFSSLISPSHQAFDDQDRQIDSQTVTDCPSSNPIVCEIDQWKLKVARLESALDSSTEQLNARSRYVEKCEKKIEEMNHEFEHLQSVLSKLKYAEAEEERVKELEIEVKRLWKAKRKSKFELHVLRTEAEEAENQVETLASQAEQMANIVTELWIQIQQLEQALEITKIRRAKHRRDMLYRRCTLFKLIRSLSQSTYTERSTWEFYLSKALKWLMRFLSTVKSHHHQLQGIVRREMERHDFTAPLANAEVVFFVASAFILFPIMGAWMILSSQWSAS